MIVEDGSIVPGADSLVDIPFADAYADSRFNLKWPATADPEAALVLGTSLILNQNIGNWKGSIVDVTQPLAWPRTGVYDADGRLIPDDEIPVQLKQAVVEAAIRFGSSVDLYADPPTSGVVRSQRTRVGPIEKSIDYFAGTSSSRHTVPIINDLLRGLVLHPMGQVSVRTLRRV